MQRIILAFLLFCVVQANAIYVSTSIGDSRLQTDNNIYKPGGVIHWALEAGFFNETENLIDYKLAVGIDRSGYSHSDGDESVSLWELYFKPMVWSVTFHNVMFEVAPFLGWMFTASGITDYDDQLFYGYSSIKYQINLGYEYRLGYQINESFFVGLTANYRTNMYGFHHTEKYDASNDDFIIGGWGLNFQYNLPW